tara:strand:- start:3566 stop:4714 length:1149 start_codon:yes stop_codon:yes gene_type:complete
MIKYILSHPVQYQAPLIRYLSKKLKLIVCYRSNISLKKYYDRDFNKKIIIDKDLIKGYNFIFLKHIGPNKVGNFFPLTTEFVKRIFDHKTKIIWIHGIKNWYNLIIIIFSKFSKKKIFVRDEFNNVKHRSFLNIFLNKLFFFIIDYFVDCYLSVGSKNRDAYKFFGVSDKKIYKVPWVVDNNKFFTKKKNNKNKIEILFTGKLIYIKGCDILLSAIHLLNKDQKFKNKIKVNIIGDGVLKNELINFKKEKKLSNVHFLGFKKQSTIRSYYKRANIFIIPSRQDNWGLALNEAMAAKNAIISSDKVGSSFDLVINNFNGYTYANNDYKLLARQILKLYKDEKKINQFGNNSHKIISKWSFKECLIGINKALRYISLNEDIVYR